MLVARFGHTGQVLARPSKDARAHFKDEEILRGRIELPSKRLTGWREVGEVERVEWHFRGPHFAPEGHEHVFKKMPVLYRRGAMLRLEPVDIDDRGFIS